MKLWKLSILVFSRSSCLLKIRTDCFYKYVDCYYVLQKNSPACSCVDCPATCPIPPPQPGPAVPFLIAGMDGYAVIMTFVFVIGTVLFLLVACLCPSKRAIGTYNPIMILSSVFMFYFAQVLKCFAFFFFTFRNDVFSEMRNQDKLYIKLDTMDFKRGLICCFFGFFFYFVEIFKVWDIFIFQGIITISVIFLLVD